MMVQRAQGSLTRVQAPLSLITWYLFQNRPFKMWPLENIIFGLGKVGLCRARAAHPSPKLLLCPILAPSPPALATFVVFLCRRSLQLLWVALHLGHT